MSGLRLALECRGGARHPTAAEQYGRRAVSQSNLSVAEWAVLGWIAGGRTHGFAVGNAFAHDGSIGSIWRVPRPLVYRAIASLVACGFVQEMGSSPGSGGPQRRLVEATPEGREALGRWLAEPVRHIRDARPDLLIKLFLLERSGEDPTGLLGGQAQLLGSIADELRTKSGQSEGFDATLARWRLYSVEALLHFVEETMELTSASHSVIS
jgi:DNA-binding PadR family transcriptional regulator